MNVWKLLRAAQENRQSQNVFTDIHLIKWVLSVRITGKWLQILSIKNTPASTTMAGTIVTGSNLVYYTSIFVPQMCAGWGNQNLVQGSIGRQNRHETGKYHTPSSW